EKEVVGRKDVIAYELIQRAVEVVCAAPQRDIDRGASAVPLLGVEARGLNLELLNCIGGRYKRDSIAAAAVVVSVWYAVQRKFVSAYSRNAVGNEVRAAVVIERSREFQ